MHAVLDLMRTDEFVALQSVVRDFVDDRVATLTPHPDEEAIVPRGVTDALAEMGLLSPRPVEDGGEGVPDHLTWTMIAEELGRGDAGTALDVVAGVYAAVVVGRCGTSEQRQVLAGSGAGRGGPPRGTLLYYEGFGRDPLELTATAEGGAITGRKIGVVRADASAFGVAVVRTDGGLAAHLLDGTDLAALSGATEHAETIGARSASLATVVLTGGVNRLDGADGIELHRCVAGYRLAVASIMLGTAESAIRYAAYYAAERQAFGRAISEFQGVAFPLVDAEIAVDAARLAVRDLAAEIDVTDDPRRLAEVASDVVAGASQAGVVATGTAVNTLGGHGYLTDHPVERWYRDAAVLAAMDFDVLMTDWSATR